MIDFRKIYSDEHTKSLYVECSCGSSEHMLRFSYILADIENSSEMYCHVYLIDQSFWRRLINGFKYIFGYKSRYGDFTEVIIPEVSAAQLHHYLEHYLITKAQERMYAVRGSD